ncbi:MAG: GNAT family N-acetyltransferase [Methylocystaceae bacterium]|nr:GNAT family N-acetyltransferase [Methylocystaceae bacterium]
MITRLLTPEDKNRWLVLWAQYLDFYDVDLPNETTELVWQRILDKEDALQAYGAVEGDLLVGCVHYFFHGTTWKTSSYCYLEDLFVDQKQRSKGAGRALIQAVKTAAEQKGAAKVYWHTDKQNKTAQALYNKVANLTDFILYDIPL